MTCGERTVNMDRVLIELVGPQGVGKSTVGPRVAAELGLECFSGQGFHGMDGHELSAAEVRRDRFTAVARRPDLFVRVLTAVKTPIRQRLRAAFNLTRREQFAARLGSGVVESGPMHGLAQTGTNFASDLTSLEGRVTAADVYVRLDADPATVVDRWAERERAADRRDHHIDWIERYGRQMDQLLEGRRVVTVDASGAVDDVVAAIVTAVRGSMGLPTPV